MLSKVTAVEYVRPMNAGRTCPLLINCERADGTVVATATKFAAYCDLGAANLAREVIGACLAGDLGLPLPEPLIVEIPPGWSAVIPDPVRRGKVDQSGGVAFGSALVTGGYSAWTADTHITGGMFDTAAAIFAFDAIIQNTDRRSDNPNCLVRGDEIRIFDHELAFAHRLVLLWRAPWLQGGLNWLEREGAHIFRRDLLHEGPDFGPFAAKWSAIADVRLTEYRSAVPQEWRTAAVDIDSALNLIREARDRIDDCVAELQRVLS